MYVSHIPLDGESKCICFQKRESKIKLAKGCTELVGGLNQCIAN